MASKNLLLLALVGVALAQSCEASADVTKSRNGKTVSLAEAQRRCGFLIWLPDRQEFDYSLSGVRIDWVTRNPGFPELPPRVAVCLLYRNLRSGNRAFVMETHTFPRINKHTNVSTFIGQGYFAIPILVGMRKCYRTERNVDIALITYPCVPGMATPGNNTASTTFNFATDRVTASR